jgi:hypothetical protein
VEPPFLELAFYVGENRAMSSMDSVKAASTIEPGGQRFIGLPGRPEEIYSTGPKVIVRTEGEDFCGPMRSNTGRLGELGHVVSDAFLRIAGAANCMYGAILVEYELETPSELRRDSRSLAFHDFFLSRKNLPPDVFAAAMVGVTSGAYTRETSDGMYVSMSREFNPEGRQVETELAHQVSVRVAVALGKLMQ